MAKRICSIFVIVGLIATLWAMPAFADDLAAGQVATDSGESNSEQATVNMNVLTKIGDMKCTYNDMGLIAKRANASTTVTFKYSGTNIKSYTSKFKHGRSKSTTTGKLTYKKGKLAKLVEKGASGTATDTYTYSKAGLVAKYTHKVTNQKKIKYTCSYDANGRLAKRNASGGDKTKTSYTYDGQGNLSSATSKYGSRGYTFAYDNKYKSGLLVKKTTTITSLNSYSTTSKYTYTTIEVPKEYVDAVTEQQWSLLNPQVSFTYPLNY